jgi:lysophospholipase L1-like esterase
MIKHAKVNTNPDSSDPSKIRPSDWNNDHQIDDPIALSAALGIKVVAGDPNGTVSGSVGDLARDTVLGQLWLNTSGGSAWTSLVRADGGEAQPNTMFAVIGDSNVPSAGVNTDKAAGENDVFVPKFYGVLDMTYAIGSSEPLTMIDKGTGALRIKNAGASYGYGPELSFAKEMYDLLNGAGTAPTTNNTPWFAAFGISGIELKQWLPGSTYGQTSFSGTNLYNTWKTRMQVLLAASGRKLGGIIISLGGNDATNSPDANAVAANMVTLATQIRADFGQQVVIVWWKLHAQADLGTVPFRDTVRAQQVAGAAAIPMCRLISQDDRTLLSDFLHLGADEIWTMGGRSASAMADLLGLQRRRTSLVAVRGYGTPDYDKATLTPPAYPLTQDGDTELLFASSTWLSGTPTAIPTPAGWTQIGSSSSTASGETEEFALFTRSVLQAELDANGGVPASVSITPGGTETKAQRFTLFGPNRFPTLDGSTVAFAGGAFGTGAVSAGGVTTTSPNDAVLTFISGEANTAGPGSQHFTVTNANTAPSKVKDATYLITSTTNSGSIAVYYGIKIAASATGATSITPAVTTNPCGFTGAWK